MSELRPAASVNVSATSNESALNNINILQPNAFRLLIDRKYFPNLEFFAQSVVHPDVAATAAETAFRRTRVPFAADKLEFGEFVANIILDENLNSYTEMFNWVNRLVDQKEIAALDASKAIPPTECDITVSILSSHNNTVRTIKYIDCVPTGLGSIQLESVSGPDQYITYAASFRYSYFELT